MILGGSTFKIVIFVCVFLYRQYISTNQTHAWCDHFSENPACEPELPASGCLEVESGVPLLKGDTL